MRHAARRDANEPELIGVAERCGAWMVETQWPADWLMWRAGVGWDVVEIKRPDKQGWASEYTAKQKRFRAEAVRRGARLLTWRTIEDVVSTMNGRVSA